MKTKYKILIVTLMFAVLLVPACSGGGSKSGEINVSVEDDFSFEPSNLRISAGQEITITFTNHGAVEHTFNILKAGEDLDHLLEEDSHGEADEHGGDHDDGDDHDDSDDHDDGDNHSEEDLHERVLFEMHEVKPGDSATKTFTAPSEAGEYVIFCALPGHADAGMVGTLTVEP